MQIEWNLFEASHGKGPADSIGGIIKRMADDEVDHGKDIPNATSMFNALSTHEGSLKTKLFFIKEEDMKRYDDLTEKPIDAIKGTRELHQIVSRGNGIVQVRDASCNCRNNFTCSCYNSRKIKLSDTGNNVQKVAEVKKGGSKKGKNVSMPRRSCRSKKK